MYNREPESFYQNDSSTENYKIPDSNHYDSRLYSDIEFDFDLDNFPNEREYNSSYSIFSLPDFLENESFKKLKSPYNDASNNVLGYSSPSFHLDNLFLGENFDNLMDDKQVKAEPFEQNINENNNNNHNENPLNSFVLDISQTGKNYDENFLVPPIMFNLSESVINYNNEEEEDNDIKKYSSDLINDCLDQSFYNSINYFFYGNNDQSKLSKNNEKNSLIKNSQNSTKNQTNNNSFNKTNSLLSNTPINSISFINLNKTNSHLSNAKMNLSSNSNLNIINSDLLNIKRERESKSNSNKTKFITFLKYITDGKKKYKRKMHTKYKDDNIFKKLKILCIRFIIKRLNDELKKNKSVDYGGKKFVNISNNTHSKSDYEALMKQTFKTILSGEASKEKTSKIISSEKISSRKSIKENVGGCSNQILINKIYDLSERNKEFSNIVEILNINFKEFWKRVSDIEKIKKRENNLNEINKKDKFLNQLAEKFFLYINDNLKIKSKNPEDIKNYKIIFYNKMKEFHIKSYQRIRKKKDDSSTLKQKK